MLPRLAKDATDRNRTSPFAFTGNKFEFRMLGSAQSVSEPNTVLNTIVAEALDVFADELEKAGDLEGAVHALIQKTMKEHKRIIFNGDGYAAAWQEEAEKRGLLNLKSTPDALAHLADEKNVKLFEKYRIFTETEVHSRYEIKMEGYCKVIGIEALTMLELTRKQILPSVSAYVKELSEAVIAKKAACPAASCEMEAAIIEKLSSLSASLFGKANTLDEALLGAKISRRSESAPHTTTIRSLLLCRNCAQ